MKTIAFAFVGLVLISCSSSTDYTQIERLGRPAINEGLVLSNAKLNAFNSVAPTQDLSSADVLAEVVTVLTVLFNTGTTATLSPPLTADVAAGFLPDVMRIDTTQASGYIASSQLVTGVAGTTTPAMLTGGRMITDDVIDNTLSYLLGGLSALPNSVGDNVSYTGAGGNANLQGHHAKLASFPYLATPN